MVMIGVNQMTLDGAKDWIVFPFKYSGLKQKFDDRDKFRLEWRGNLTDMRRIEGMNDHHVLMKDCSVETLYPVSARIMRSWVSTRR